MDRPDNQFACGRGHVLTARNRDGNPADLTGHFCPLCLGQVEGHGDIIDSRLLAPVQAVEFTVQDAKVSSSSMWPEKKLILDEPSIAALTKAMSEAVDSMKAQANVFDKPFGPAPE